MPYNPSMAGRPPRGDGGGRAGARLEARVSPRVKEALRRLAEADRRSETATLEVLVEAEARRRGLWAEEEGRDSGG